MQLFDVIIKLEERIIQNMNHNLLLSQNAQKLIVIGFHVIKFSMNYLPYINEQTEVKCNTDMIFILKVMFPKFIS